VIRFPLSCPKLTIILLALSAAPVFAGQAPAVCDRICLGGMLTQYIDALVAHDASKLPLTPDVRFTEDSKDLKLGEGLWKTVSAKGGFRQDYLDTAKQIAAAHVELKEGTIPVLYSVLLRVQDRKIHGIETLVQRITPDSRFQPTMLGKPLVGMNDPIPADKKLSRAAMIRTALTYTEGLRVGSFVNATPFSKEAYRIENGMFMAGTGCPRAECPAIQTQRIMDHPEVQASVAAVDEDNGVVLLWMNFGDTGSYGQGNSLITFEAFKVWGDEIHVVHAFFRTQPKETQRTWASTDPMPSPLEARLQRLEDERAIERVLIEYGRSLDARDFAAYSALFAKDGEWKGGFGSFRGPAAIKAAMEKTFATATEIPKGNNFHVMSNFNIKVQGDRATAHSMFMFFRMNGSKPEPVVTGRYEDTLIREDGVWRFQQRNALPPG
jgi:3-phenylpropionate/cinnamic acid dioxygenase small subunit